MAAARPRLVLCHNDIHLANLLVGHDGRLAVVDWDGLRLAARERDLMFVAGQQRARFLEGYGPAELDGQIVAQCRSRQRWPWRS